MQDLQKKSRLLAGWPEYSNRQKCLHLVWPTDGAFELEGGTTVRSVRASLQGLGISELNKSSIFLWSHYVVAFMQNKLQSITQLFVLFFSSSPLTWKFDFVLISNPHFVNHAWFKEWLLLVQYISSFCAKENVELGWNWAPPLSSPFW